MFSFAPNIRRNSVVYNLATEHFPLRSGDRSRIDSQLSELYMDNMGAEVLHLWIESLRDFIAERTPKEAKGPENDALTHSPTDARRADELAAAVAPLAVDEPQGEEETYEIIEGDQIVDRKSVFQVRLSLCCVRPFGFLLTVRFVSGVFVSC